MTKSEETSSFLERVDSIQERFIRSLITGQHDPMLTRRKQTPEHEVGTQEDMGQSDSSETFGVD